MWIWYIAWAWMGVMVWMILFDHIRPNRRERSIDKAEGAPPNPGRPTRRPKSERLHVGDPRPSKARCLGSTCGRCQNCYDDMWSAVWRQLEPEDKQWVIDQFTYVGLTEWDARPSLTRWELR